MSRSPALARSPAWSGPAGGSSTTAPRLRVPAGEQHVARELELTVVLGELLVGMQQGRSTGPDLTAKGMVAPARHRAGHVDAGDVVGELLPRAGDPLDQRSDGPRRSELGVAIPLHRAPGDALTLSLIHI